MDGRAVLLGFTSRDRPDPEDGRLTVQARFAKRSWTRVYVLRLLVFSFSFFLLSF